MTKHRWIIGLFAVALALAVVVPRATRPARATTASVAVTRYVTAAYYDFLDRPPSAAELQYWVAQFQAGAPGHDLTGYLAGSPEWVGRLVTDYYEATLGRAPDSAGLAYWVGMLRSGRTTPAHVAAQFFASAEYFRNEADSNIRTWLSNLYYAVLRRQPDDPGISYWASVAAAAGRGAVAYLFYQSPESAHDRVENLYLKFLGRDADLTGGRYWAQQILKTGDLSLAADLAGSSEYFRRAQIIGVTQAPAGTFRGVTQLLPDGATACAVANALAYCWGGASYLLGRGPNAGQALRPTVVPGLADVTHLYHGSGAFPEICAIAGGALYCWGTNGHGQLGNGTTDTANRPTLVPGLTDVTDVTLDIADLLVTTPCAIANGGHVYCWGDNGAGQVTHVQPPVDKPQTILSPTLTPGLTGATAVVSSSGTVCAVANGGHLYCWGRNLYGQVGNGETGTDVPNPTQVPGLDDVSAVTISTATVCATANGGKLYCWGNNWTGAAGVGLNADGTPIHLVARPVPVGLAGVTEITGARYAMCAVAQGAAYCWGAIDAGLLSNGTTSPNGYVYAPHRIPLLTDVQHIESRNGLTCAVANGGRAYCWGGTEYGELGSNTVSHLKPGIVFNPTRVPGLNDVTAVDPAGPCALANGGSMYCWGFNEAGELGDGTTENASIPMPL